MNATRRTLLNLLGLAALLPLAARAGDDAKPLVEVWKSPSCGCCKDWVAHMEANGFIVKTFDAGNHDMRARLGMPVAYGSCHTAQVRGYVLEGHVPASDVQRLLMEKPKALGLAVCRRCRLVRPAWTVRSTRGARIPTTCCWCSATVLRACIAATADPG